MIDARRLQFIKVQLTAMRDKVADERVNEVSSFGNRSAAFHLQSALENALSEVIEAQTYLREVNRA